MPLVGRAIFVHVLRQLAELIGGGAYALLEWLRIAGTTSLFRYVMTFLLAFQLFRRAAQFGVQLAADIFEPRFCLGIVL